MVFMSYFPNPFIVSIDFFLYTHKATIVSGFGEIPNIFARNHQGIFLENINIICIVEHIKGKTSRRSYIYLQGDQLTFRCPEKFNMKESFLQFKFLDSLKSIVHKI